MSGELGFARMTTWWLFVGGFFWFLPSMDKRVRTFVFFLMMLMLSVAVRSCAEEMPFYM